MKIFGAVCFFAHGLLLTVLGTSMGQAADQTTEKPDEFSLFADLQQQITDLKIQMSKVIKDKTKCETEIKSLQTRVENFEDLYSADKTETRSLYKKMLAIESVFNPNIWLTQPSTGPGGLSEIGNTLDSLQGKVETLARQVSGIDHKVFGKSCEALILSEGSPKKLKIYPNGRDKPGVEVLCDFETEGGTWTVIQKRGSGPTEEFYRNWTEYENGFGSVDGNYWIGLKTIYTLTKSGDQELRTDLWDFEGDHAFAKYFNFSISDSSDFYRLNVGGYSGTAGNSLYNLNGMRFSTKDKDNDEDSLSCAKMYRGAWWYKHCAGSNLNGLYYEKEEGPKLPPSVIFWNGWKEPFRALRQVEMKIRSRR